MSWTMELTGMEKLLDGPPLVEMAVVLEAYTL